MQQFAIKDIFTTSTTAGSGIDSNYYRPFTTLSFAIDHSFWGMKELPFHLTNTLLHATTAVIIFTLLLLLKFSKRQSAAIALIFAVHPIQTEAVTYINSRGDSLYSFFGISSIVILVLLYKKIQPKFSLYNLHVEFISLLQLITIPILYAASILSKEIGIMVIGLQIISLLHIFYTTDEPFSVKTIKKHLFSVVAVLLNLTIAAIYLVLRATALNFNNSFNFYNDTSLYATSIVVRLLTFSKVIWQYFALLLFPYPLHMERKIELVTSVFSIWPLLTILCIVAIICSATHEYKKLKKMHIAFGSAWFFCALVPVSGIIPINGILYEHWLYLPMVGFFITCFGLLNLFLPKNFYEKIKENFSMILSILILLLSIVTIRQNYFWSTPIRLYEYLLRHTESSRIYNNLGMAYADAKQYEKAIENYNTALSYGEKNPAMLHNLGNAYRDSGQLEKAVSSYEEALKSNPKFFFTYIPLLQVYQKLGAFEKAFSVIELAQNNNPNEPLFYFAELEFAQQLKDTNRISIVSEKVQKQFKNRPDVLTEFNTYKEVQNKNSTVK